MTDKKRSRLKSRLLSAQIESKDAKTLTMLRGVFAKADGKIQRAAVLLGIPRRTLNTWRDRYPVLNEIIEKARATAEAEAEGSVEA